MGEGVGVHGDGQGSRDGRVSCLVSGHMLATRGSVHGSVVGSVLLKMASWDGGGTKKMCRAVIVTATRVYHSTIYRRVLVPPIGFPLSKTRQTCEIDSQPAAFSITAVWTSSGATSRARPLCVRPISSAKVEWGFQAAECRAFVSSIILSTCSRERPLVSG